jgi:hypothetical protein
MRKKLSVIVLAIEITAIVVLHAFRISHDDKNEKLSGPDVFQQKSNTSLVHIYSIAKLK